MTTVEQRMADELDEIFDRQLAVSVLEPGEVTASMMAEKRGISHDKARATLEMAYKRNELTRRQVRLGGRPIWAYRPAK